MTRRWPLLLGLLAGLAALYAGLATGTDPADAWSRAARWTARVGLPIFLLTYLASSLGRLWPGGWARTVWRDRRWWGLGFAAAHTVHLYALIRAVPLSGEERSLASLIPGGLAYLVMYLMALTSSEAAIRALGRNWKRLHSFGIHYLWLIFTLAYSLRIGSSDTRIEGLAGAALCYAALTVRLFVWRRGRKT